MIYPGLNYSTRWKSDCIFFEKYREKENKNMAAGKDQLLKKMFEELSSAISANFLSFVFITNVT